MVISHLLKHGYIAVTLVGCAAITDGSSVAGAGSTTCRAPLSPELCAVEELATAAIYFTPCTTRERVNRANGCTTSDLRNTDPSGTGWEFNNMSVPEQKAMRKHYKQNVKKEMEQSDE